ncbi:MAG: winged helix-turn-helix transcriptional regulator [Endomicrobium sp.]|nr:winged helix-turn-helix transcriptional regulator [Endomicrobium sp.]
MGKKRFGKLKRSIPKISQKVLTDNLRPLEQDRLIERTVYT